MASPKLSTRGLRDPSSMAKPPAAPATPVPPMSVEAPVEEPSAGPSAPSATAGATGGRSAGQVGRRHTARPMETPAPSIMAAQVSVSRDAESRLQDTRQSARWPIDELEPDPDQPRTEFDPEEIAALARDIERRGLDRPIDLREDKLGRKYIVDGERRWRAFTFLHKAAPNDSRWRDIPARLLSAGLTLDEIRLRQLAASLHHLPYSAIDYARQLGRMADITVQGGVGEGRTSKEVVAEIARQLSRSETWVRRHLYLVEGITPEELSALQKKRPGLPLAVLEEVLRGFRKAGPRLTEELRSEMLRLAAEPVPSPGPMARTGGSDGESGPTDRPAAEPAYRSVETLRRLYSQMLGRLGGTAKRGRRPKVGVRRDSVSQTSVELEYRLTSGQVRPDRLAELADWLRTKAGEVETLARTLGSPVVSKAAGK